MGDAHSLFYSFLKVGTGSFTCDACCFGCYIGATLFGSTGGIRMMKCRIDNDLAMRDFFVVAGECTKSYRVNWSFI